MHLGYSALLGEHIQAQAVSYDDCRSFQIVCPACREPVFKVMREVPSPIHYLSHYAADEAYAADCELRVRSMAAREIDTADTASRGQRLKLFLEVLRETVLSSQYEAGDPRQRAEDLARRFRESKGLRRYRQMLFEHAHDSFRTVTFADAEDLLDDYVTDFSSSGADFPMTGFAIDVQKRIAWDLWTHVLSRVAQGNYYFLLSHASVHLLARIDAAARSRSLFFHEHAIARGLLKLIDAEPREADIIIDELTSVRVEPPHSIEVSDAFTKMSAELTHEALGILLRLPYFEVLKAARASFTSSKTGCAEPTPLG